jgi:hypothetical protein
MRRGKPAKLCYEEAGEKNIAERKKKLGTVKETRSGLKNTEEIGNGEKELTI